MAIEFTDPPPKKVGRRKSGLSLTFTASLLKALEENPNRWAKADYADFYPDRKESTGRSHIARLAALVKQINDARTPFHEHNLEATQRQGNIYVRLVKEEE